MDESYLIHAAQKGDLESFNRLVLAHQDAVYNQAFWLLGDQDMAEDIAQDTFIKAYQWLPSFRGDSLRAWLLRTASNASYDELRRRKRRQTQPLFQTDADGEEVDTEDRLVDPGASIEEMVEQAELSAELSRHLEALPEKYRSVLVLVDLQEMDYAEAAQVLRVPMGTVKSRLARARLMLQGRLSLSRSLGRQEGREESWSLN